MKLINHRLEAFLFECRCSLFDWSIACSTIFNPSPSGELEGGHRERIYYGFTTALERSCRGSSDFQVQSYNAFSSIQKFCLFLLR